MIKMRCHDPITWNCVNVCVCCTSFLEKNQYSDPQLRQCLNLIEKYIVPCIDEWNFQIYLAMQGGMSYLFVFWNTIRNNIYFWRNMIDQPPCLALGLWYLLHCCAESHSKGVEGAEYRQEEWLVFKRAMWGQWRATKIGASRKLSFCFIPASTRI